MNKQQLLDEAELCGSRRVSVFAKPKSQIYTAEPSDISIELTIASKYRHGGRLRKAIT